MCALPVLSCFTAVRSLIHFPLDTHAHAHTRHTQSSEDHVTVVSSEDEGRVGRTQPCSSPSVSVSCLLPPRRYTAFTAHTDGSIVLDAARVRDISTPPPQLPPPTPPHDARSLNIIRDIDWPALRSFSGDSGRFLRLVDVIAKKQKRNQILWRFIASRGERPDYIGLFQLLQIPVAAS